MNFAVYDSKTHFRRATLYCTCGEINTAHFKQCPKCGAPVLKYIKKFKNYVRYSHCESECDDAKASFKNLIVDLPNGKAFSYKVLNPVHQNLYEVNIDYRLHNVAIKCNGTEVEITPFNCRAAMTGIDSCDYDNLLSEISYTLLDTINCGDAIYYFYKHPQVEVIYSTYKSLDMLSGVTPLSGSKPHEIMGLSKPALRFYLDYMNSGRYRHSFLHTNHYIEYIKKLDAFYADKPDCLKRVFDFMKRIDIEDFSEVYSMITKHNYDLQKLEIYLLDDIYTYQGIEDARSGFQILSDYIEACDEMNAPVDKYPKSLKLAHDIAMKNLKVVISEKEALAFKEAVSDKSYEKLQYQNKDYKVIIPKTAEDVINEGRRLHHCVGSYVNRIGKGETKICFMRKVSDVDTPLVTLEVKDGKLTQYRGNCNRHPSKEEMEFILEYAKAKSIDVI